MGDSHGNLPVHYAIQSHDTQCIETMLTASKASCSEKLRDDDHLLYRAIESQAWNAIFLMENLGWPIDNVDLSRVHQFASACGLDKEWEFVESKMRDSAGSKGSCLQKLQDFDFPPDFSRRARTALMTHSLCLKHVALLHEIDDLFVRQDVIKGVFENPHRL